MRWMAIVLVVGVSGGAGCKNAFDDYRKKAKRSEAELQLHKLEKSLKMAYVSESAFPTLSLALTPAEACCNGPGHRCQETADEWAAWAPVDFMIDEPHVFQYRLESNPTGFIATAVGDADCDLNTIEYKLLGEAKDGTPTTTFVPPDPSSD